MPRHGCAKRTLALAILAALLSGCVGATSSVVVRCATVTPLSPEQQRRAAGELAALPEDGVVRSVLVPDYGRMRDEARACRGTR